MTLREKRVLFTRCLAALIEFANEQPGYDVAVDQVKRTKAEAEANAAAGTGIANSVHLHGLAADILLYLHGKYIEGSEGYRALGTFWKQLHPLCRWGGDFSRPDGGHFSLEHEGVK